MKKHVDLEAIKNLLPYKNKWVALDKSYTRVLVSGSTINEVETRLKKTRKKAVEIRYILPFDQYYCPYDY